VDQVIADTEVAIGGALPADEVAKIHAIAAKAPSHDSMLAPALVNTATALLVWARAIYAIRRQERKEAAE
jgi:hypothetical protein